MYNINIPPEALEAFPPLPEPYQKEILATSKNTVAVREGYEMGGYVKHPDLYTEEQMEEYARAACIAMLKAWPGMRLHQPSVPPRPPAPRAVIILPLPPVKEPSE